MHPVNGVVKFDYSPAGRKPGVDAYESGVVVDNINTFKFVTPVDGETLRETAGTSWSVYFVKKGVA